MRATEEQHNARKREMMEKCFECYAENGLTGTGIKALAKACGCTTGNLYSYFSSVDELIIESTAYCMEKVEDDFMEMAPTDAKDVVRFVKEVPYWTAKKHGKKYRLMYQIYTHPKYIEHGKKFFEGVNERYTEYAKRLEPKITISASMELQSHEDRSGNYSVQMTDNYDDGFCREATRIKRDGVKLPYSRDQHHFSFSRIYIASDEDIPLRFRIEQSSYKTTLLGFNGTITITALD